MLEMMWSKGNTTLLLVGMEICTTTLEINMVVSQKIRNQPSVYFLPPLLCIVLLLAIGSVKALLG